MQTELTREILHKMLNEIISIEVAQEGLADSNGALKVAKHELEAEQLQKEVKYYEQKLSKAKNNYSNLIIKLNQIQVS